MVYTPNDAPSVSDCDLLVTEFTAKADIHGTADFTISVVSFSFNNGLSSVTPTGNYDDTLSVDVYEMTPSPIAITSLAAPQKYAEPDTAVEDGEGYTVDSVVWQTEGGADAGDYFAPDTVYEATVTLDAADGYQFNDDQTVDVTDATDISYDARSADTLTFTATFDATAEGAVTYIEIAPTDGTVAVPTAASGTANELQMSATCKDGGETVTYSPTWSILGTYTGISIDNDGLLSVDNTAASNFGSGSNSMTITVKAASTETDDEVTVTITRENSIVASISVEGGQESIDVPFNGEDANISDAFAAMVYDQYGYEMGGQMLDWDIEECAGVSISGGAVSVTNDAKAAITDTEGESLTVTVMVGSVSGTASITVKRAASAAASVTVGGGQVSIEVPADGASANTSAAFTVTVLDQYGAAIAEPTVTWSVKYGTDSVTGVTIANGVVSVANSAKATVANETGIGFTVSATVGPFTDTDSIVVKRAAQAFDRIEITRGGSAPLTSDMLIIPPAGQPTNTYTYTAKVYDQYSAQIADSGTWSDDIGALDGVTRANGTVTVYPEAVAADNAFTLTYTDQGGAHHKDVEISLSTLAVDWDEVDAAFSETQTYGASYAAFFDGLPATGTASDGTATVNGTFAIVETGIPTVDDTTVTVKFTVTSGAYDGVELTKSYAITVEPKELTATMIAAIPAVEYTGSAITPTPAVTYGALTLTVGDDFTFDYENNTNAGTGTATLTINFVEGGNYTGSAQKTFNIGKKAITADMVAAIAEVTYTGSVHTPTPAVTYNSMTLMAGTDFSYGYTGNLNAGQATVTITGAGTNYTGTFSKPFTIAQKTLETSMIADIAAETYTGTARTPSPAVTYNTMTLVMNTDYTVNYTGNTNAGTATVTVTAKAGRNYSGEASKTFTISPKALEASMIGTISPQTYTGAALTPTPAVTYLTKTLVSGTDFTFGYSGNINAGTATLTVTAEPGGNYSGEAQKAFTISPKALLNAMIGDIPPEAYTGAAIMPTPVVTYLTNTLSSVTDFTFSYTNNTNVGTATLTITAEADGNYSGTAYKTFTITKKALEASMIADIPALTYTGAAQTPAPVVTYNSMTLVNNTDYTCSYTGNKNAGTATLTVTAKSGGNYSGSAQKTFAIGPYAVGGKITFSAIADATFTGSAVKPAPTVTVDLNGTPTALAAGTDFTFGYSANVNAGAAATVTVTGAGNYSGSASTTFNIVAKPVEASMVSGIAVSYTYTGFGVTPEPTLIFNNKGMVKDTDYGVAYLGNTAAGAATLRITGEGNYSGSVDIPFTIAPAVLGGTARIISLLPIVEAGVLLTVDTSLVTPAGLTLGYQWYSGGVEIEGAIAPSYLVVSGDTTIYVVVSPTDLVNCTGSLQSQTVEVGKTDIASGRVLSIIATDGSAVGSVLSAELTGLPLAYGDEYTLQWLRGDTVISTAETYTLTRDDLGYTVKVIMTGAGPYTGTLLASQAVAAVVPDAPALTVTAGTKSLSIRWTAPFNGGSELTKYTLTVGGETYTLPASYTSFTVSGLTGGEEYTVTMTAANGVGSSAVTTASGTPRSSSGGGGGGGGGSAVVPTTPVGDSNVEYTYEKSGGKVKLDVDAKDLDELLGGNNPPDTIALDLGGVGGAQSAVLPNGLLAAIAAANEENGTSAGVTLNMPNYTITLDGAALASVTAQADGKNVEIAVSEAELNSAQQAAAGDHAVFDVSVSCGGAEISDLGGGAVTVEVPYALREGETADDIVVYYLDDEGYLRQIEDFTYDEETGTMSFTLPHLSDYMIAQSITLPFADVAANSWFNGAVRFVYQNGLFNGTGGTAFSPELTMNRAMFVTVLGRLAKANVDPGAPADFTDVVLDSWSSGYIAWATNAGVIQGYGGGLFGQYDSITRQQMAVILYNYAKWAGYNVSDTGTAALLAFTDGAGTASWAMDAMAWAVNTGLLGGSGNAVTPGAPATRAQVAQIITNFFDNVIG
ncbi:MAG TPA: S-layer homology domain-containing protein [Candidatus Acidoferrum sp.]|nr:S-layer homology domain-containing protein [Candidatus Acidoferrum sp.]